MEGMEGMEMTIAELVIYLIDNGHAKGLSEALELLGFKK